MTVSAKSKNKTIPAYVARVTISIPIAMDDPKSFETASKAVGNLESVLPNGSTVKVHGAAFGKMGA